MKFEDLKDLFKSNLVNVVANSGFGDFKGKCVKLFLNGGNGVSIKKIEKAENSFEISLVAETKTQEDRRILKQAISMPYFCKLMSTTKNDGLLSIINVPSIDEDSMELQIGVENRFNDVTKKFNDDYLLKIADSEYFIMGKNVYSQDNESTFIIINNKRKYLSVKSKRKGDVISCNDETADDKILVISEEEKEVRNLDSYRLVICKNKIQFDNASYVAKQTAQTLAFVKSGLDKYISIWHLFAEKEFDYAKKIVEEAGRLYYKGIENAENDEYLFEIKNKENVENFINELEKFDREGKRIVVKKERYVQGQLKPRNYVFSYKNFKDGSLIAKLESGNANKLDFGEGSLEISIAGNEMQYERRISAIERIKNGKSAKPELIRLLNGDAISSPKKPYVNPLSPTVIERFGGLKPNPNQELAIDIILNTPDIAIIQGPPGTGKTKVVEASRIRMSEESENKNLSFGKVLLTAYQRDATRAMGKNLDIYGLPIPIYAEDATAKTEEIENWIEKKAEEIEKKHSKLYEKWYENRLGRSLDKIESGFNKDTFILENATTVAMEIKSCVEKISKDILKDELSDLFSLIEKTSEKRTSFSIDYLTEKIKNLPTSEISYEDDGKKLVEKTKIVFKEEIDEKNEKAISIFEEMMKEYEADKIEFSKVKKLKNKLLKYMIPESNLLPSREVNDAIEAILEKAKEHVQNYELNDEESIIAKYIEAFKETPETVRQSLKDFQTVVGATHQKAVGIDIGNIKEQDYTDIEYDNVIIDEAARSCPPDLLIPMSCAKDRIVLIGDHKQLPQFISRDVLKTITKEELEDVNLLSETVFEHLIEVAKKLEAIDGIKRFVTLDTQYRMPKLLGDFTSRNFYEKTDDGKKESTLNIPVTIKTPEYKGYDEKFKHNLPGIENKCAVWLDVPNVSSASKEKRKAEGGYSRPEEAKRIAAHLKMVLDSKKATDLTFGIISFYAEQVKEIRKVLKEEGILNDEYKISNEYRKNLKSITVETVDKMQGLEFDVVYLSMTRSTKRFDKKTENRFGFLDDQHRICVALTRQKRCLIVCGDKEMLKGEDAMEKIPALVDFYDLCKKGGNQVAII